MERYIKTSTLARIVFDKWKECEELVQIIPDIRKAVMCESTVDLVPKERYASLLANAIIVSNALKEYKTADFVKVVRCKECRSSTTMKDENGFNFRVCCHYWYHGMIVNDTDYCSQGRRDDEHN